MTFWCRPAAPCDSTPPEPLAVTGAYRTNDYSVGIRTQGRAVYVRSSVGGDSPTGAGLYPFRIQPAATISNDWSIPTDRRSRASTSACQRSTVSGYWHVPGNRDAIGKPGCLLFQEPLSRGATGSSSDLAAVQDHSILASASVSVSTTSGRTT